MICRRSRIKHAVNFLDALYTQTEIKEMGGWFLAVGVGHYMCWWQISTDWNNSS